MTRERVLSVGSGRSRIDRILPFIEELASEKIFRYEVSPTIQPGDATNRCLMPFPFSLEGTVAIEMVDLAPTMSAVETAIRKRKPTVITRDGAKITFRAGLFRLRLMTNWNVLIPIGSGELLFSQEGDRVLIRYSVSLVELFVTVTLMLLIMLGIVPILAGEHTLAPLAFLPVGWLWLFGMNYLTTNFRFPRFLRTAGENARVN